MKTMNTTQQKANPTSAADSFFGMTLAMAFTGSVYGADMVQTYNACEAASEVYKDKYQNATNGFQLGVKNSLGKVFASIDNVFQSVSEMDIVIEFDNDVGIQGNTAT
jgi:hypothetical protein